ncbi:ABC transporter permease [Bifidobacterium italicum]|uniref:ABC transporter permease n=1 Tax=Bifidobacterium italicum TaxID=1960968 RepID=A0A2A2ELK3_9BIFI|nr:FtsX-like permease family protein [Bifidobacterium italicum]PAU69951.1 ABC transporter permease [Bifidobacterium italicum]
MIRIGSRDAKAHFGRFVMSIITIESVILSVFGTLLGILVGLAAAAAVVRQAYRDDGLPTMSIPWAQLAGFLVPAILVGLVASVSPASRALRKPVLQAVAGD